MRHHLGIVGAGAIARDHALTLSRLRGLGGLSVYDSNREAAMRLAKDYSAEVHSSLEALVEKSDIVWICTPPFARREAIFLASAAGKAIFCEKPLAISRQDLRRFEAEIAKSKVPFFMGQSGRFSAFTVKMKQLMDKGLVGRPVRVWASREGYLDPASTPPWRLDDALGGGTLVELGIHEIDFMRWMCGDFRKVFASGSNRIVVPGSFQDTLAAVGNMDNGVVAHLNISWASPRYLWQRGIEGEEGSLFFDDARVTEVAYLRPGKAAKIFKVETWQDPETGENQALRDQAKSIIRALRKDEGPAVSLAEGASAVEVALAMRQSAAQDRAVSPRGISGRRK